MTSRRYLPLVACFAAMAVVIAPSPQVIRVIVGIAFVLLVPGYALSRALVGARGPKGETAALTIALSISIAGLAGLLLALFHDFGRAQFVAVLALVTVVAATAEIVQRRQGTVTPTVNRSSIRTFAVMAVVASVLGLILIFAFRQDARSVQTQQRHSSVALAAVREHHALKVQVIAGGTAPFSGTVWLEGSSSRLATWTLRSLQPGETWSAVMSVVPAGPLRVTLVGSANLRFLSVAPVAKPGTTTS